MKIATAVALAVCCAAGARAQSPDGPPPSPAWVTISTEELRDRFDVLWAVSDVHGRLEELDQLMAAADLVSRHGGQVQWNGAKSRQLFVALGDYIDGGHDSVGVVLRFDQLSRQAAAAGSRVVALLGNHEAEFLADPGSAGRRLLSSVRRMRTELGLPSRPTGDQLAASEFGRFLRTLPVAAFIGSWLFAHAGYLGGSDDGAGTQSGLAGLAAIWSLPGNERYRALLDPKSIVSYHGWWKHRSRRLRMKARLADLGLNGLVFGHDPDALGFPDVVAMDPDGWLLKLDTGLKVGRSRGMLLRCDVARLVRGTRLAMSEGGKPSCQAMTPAGELQELSR